MRTLKKLKKPAIVATVLASTVLFAASDCDNGQDDSTKKEDASRSKTYDSLVENQPAETGKYSPTRETKNFWVRTWMQDPNKVAYVYLMNSEGVVTDYGVSKGLPVTYCSSLIPPYKLIDVTGDSMGANLVVPGPSVDGTYSSGTDCSRMYYEDATTGAYVEFGQGMAQQYRAYDQPLPFNRLTGAIPIGPTDDKGVVK